MRATIQKTSWLGALAAASLMMLPACQSEDVPTGEDGSGVSTKTLAALIAGESELSSVADTLSDVGLSETFDGKAAYTLFAPRDDAFAELGEELEGEEGRAARVTVLREHIVPGFFTREDIAKAIEANDGEATMQSLGSGSLTFTGSGEAIEVKTADGDVSVTLGQGMAASNGVVFPIDGVLKALPKGE